MIKPAYASIDAVATYFGVSPHTIRHWVKTGKIPEQSYIKVGNTYRFHLRAVEDALLNYKSRAGLTDAERDKIAEGIIKDLDTQVDSLVEDKNPRVSKDKLDAAEAELADKVRGVPHVKQDSELDAVVDELTDLNEELQDL